ncbi:retrovirus-related pol polyprotein from transposon TNT 1-94 [Tanacetum coccineum]
MLSSIGVKPSTSASGSHPSSNTKKDKIQQTPSSIQKNKVEAYSRTVKSSLKNKNYVVEPNRTANVQHPKLNANSELLCVKCNGCMLSDNHDLCVLDFINDVNARVKSKSVKKNSKRKVWKPTRKVVQIVLWYLDSGCSKHMTGDRSQLTNFVNKFLGTVKFGNDHVAKILGYGDYQIGNVTISRVYYVEGLGHNLFSVGQFCDSNLEVAFCQHTCFIRNLEGVDLLTGSRGNNLYTLSLGDMMASSPICLLSKASKTNKKKPHKPKSEDTNQEKRYLLHMDLCGPMRVTSVNGKKYILFIVDDYSQFTWVKCLRSKDKAPDFIIKFLKMIQYEKVGSPDNLLARFSTAKWMSLKDVILTPMASKHSSLESTLHEMTHTIISSGLVPNHPPSTPFVPPSKTDWDILFQPLFDVLLNPPSSVDRPAHEVIAPIAEVVALEPAASTGSPYQQNCWGPRFGTSPKNNSKASSSSDVIPTIVHTAAPKSEHVTKWTKDHPLDNIIVEPKNYKDALTQACWIEAMQEELNEFECLEF